VSLLVQIKGVLERTYRMRTGIDDPAPFIVGDRGFARFYAGAALPCRVDAGIDSGATTVIRESPSGTRVAVYYPDRLIRRLERHPPQRGLGERNVDAFATLVEELDHLLFVAERTVCRRPLTLFEMELHANVSKYLVLSRFLAGQRSRLCPADRLWLRHHLFHKLRYTEPDADVRDRYRDARRWALRLIDAIGTMPPQRRVEALRGFHHAGSQEKVRLIERLMRESYSSRSPGSLAARN
jgi:hypothetical protein